MCHNHSVLTETLHGINLVCFLFVEFFTKWRIKDYEPVLVISSNTILYL